ncbi:MAG: hypothetical protein AAB372_02465 [Patescibacteria group bacterium]
MAKPTLTTAKMPKETEQQYTAWLLYCEAGSLQKTLRLWERVGQSVGEMGAEFAVRLGKKPSDTTIERWSKQFRWVERKDLKLQEDLEGLREKTKRIKTERVHRIAEYFEKAMTIALKSLKENSDVTTGDVKLIWEMFRTELGETLGKHTHAVGIDESKQTPPDEEEKALGAALNDTIKKFYDKRGTPREKGKGEHPVLD